MSDETTSSKPPRGFAAMDPEARRAMAQRGGRAVQEKGNGHRWDAREAREAGRRGGIAAARNRKDEATP